MRARYLITANKPEDTPPTSDAGRLHCRRAFLQAAKWEQSDVTHHDHIPSAEESGGFTVVDGRLVAIAMSKEPFPNHVINQIVCNCAGSCQTGANALS